MSFFVGLKSDATFYLVSAAIDVVKRAIYIRNLPSVDDQVNRVGYCPVSHHDALFHVCGYIAEHSLVRPSRTALHLR